MSEENKNANPIASLIGLVAFGICIWFYFGGGLEQQTQKEMARINQQVAEDFVSQYEIAKRSGSAMEAYVHAGFVASAY